MSLIVKCNFNSQEWKGRCRKAIDDKRLFNCHNEVVEPDEDSDEEEIPILKVTKRGTCAVTCHEQKMCVDFLFVGKTSFNIQKTKGNIYFLFQDINKTFVLWGHSKIKKVKGNVITCNPFEPIPEEKRIKSIKPIRFIGKHWGNGRHRYLSKEQETYIKNKMIDKGILEKRKYVRTKKEEPTQ